jgi:hypothetical protein
MSHHKEDDVEVRAGEEKKSENDDAFLKRERQGIAHDKHISVDDTNSVMPKERPLSHIRTASQTEIGVHLQSLITSPEPTIVASDTHPIQRIDRHNREHSHLQFVLPSKDIPSVSAQGGNSPAPPLPGHQKLSTTKKILTLGLTFLKSLLNPPSIAILCSFPIALIPPLKALFVKVPSVHMPSAPDGLPPLAFFLDTTAFIGAASVPLGLICLGSALARLTVPRDREGWRTLPVGAITGFAVGKMIVMPVLGVLIVQGLVKGGVIPREDKVLQFVCMCVAFLSLGSVLMTSGFLAI